MQEDTEKIASCPVCGEAIGPAPEICPDCKTPHHWDCWQYNGGCATYACPRKVKPRTDKNSPKPPDKIPFPVLKAGTFLGVFHVRVTTAFFAFFFEFLAIVFHFDKSPLGVFLCYLFMGGMFAALIWSALTAEIYNIDIAKKRISKSLLFLNKEILEWGVCSLATVEKLYHRPDPVTKGKKRILTAFISDGSTIDLTPEYEAEGPDSFLVEELLEKLRSGTTLSIPDNRSLAIKKL